MARLDRRGGASDVRRAEGPPPGASPGLGAALVAVLLALPLAAGGAEHPAIEYWSSPTLKRIAATGVVRLGYRESSPPFAFLDAKKRPIGYSLDLCDVVVEELAREVGKELTVEHRPVTPESRFELVASGAVDLECGSSTNTAERRKVVAFSPTIFVTGTKLLVRRGSGIRSIADLQGKKVVLTRGTVHEAMVPRIAARKHLEIQFVYAADHGESFRILRSGGADAFANDEIQLFGMIAEARAAADFRVVGDFLTYADYALALRKDDPELAEVVERAFHRLTGSREILAIYERWFVKPLPSGLRLNLPMSPHLEEIFRVQGLPND